MGSHILCSDYKKEHQKWRLKQKMKEYIDKEKLIRLIENAMFQAKSYDGKLDVDSMINVLNNLKLLVKTMECIKINEKGEIV